MENSLLYHWSAWITLHRKPAGRQLLLLRVRDASGADPNGGGGDGGWCVMHGGEERGRNAMTVGGNPR